ncbi:mitogen-activated protein kinase kinase kinase ANP1 isoform X2 [Fagus crenata]
MCKIDKDDFTVQGVKLGSSLIPENFKSFNPMCESSDGWGCKFEASPEPEQTGINSDTKEHISDVTGCSGVFGEGDKDFSFPYRPSLSENDDELTESKIRSLLYQSEFLCFAAHSISFSERQGKWKEELD